MIEHIFHPNIYNDIENQSIEVKTLSLLSTDPPREHKSETIFNVPLLAAIINGVSISYVEGIMATSVKEIQLDTRSVQFTSAPFSIYFRTASAFSRRTLIINPSFKSMVTLSVPLYMTTSRVGNDLPLQIFEI